MTQHHDVAGRVQQTIPSGIVLLLAIWITFVSFNVDEARPYLFPRLIAVALLVLAAISFQRALRGKSRTGSGLDRQVVLNLIPGVVVMLVYVFYLAEFLGFYAASFAAFLVLYTLYDPNELTDARNWMHRLVISAGFMAVMYGLFALLLKVQTPRGILI